MLLTALILLFIGLIWYNPKTLANPWMKAAEVTEEKLKTGRMAIIFSLIYAMGLFISAGLMAMVIRQAQLYSIFADIAEAKDPNSEVGKFSRTLW